MPDLTTAPAGAWPPSGVACCGRWRAGARRGVAVLVLLAAPAWAQYKIVGPDGRVTYTDMPPAGALDTAPRAARAASAAAPASTLPYELRQVVARYPVRLYSTPSCGPCDQARQSLQQRGIPFTESTVTTDADRAVLQRQEGVAELPVLRVGSQRLVGWQEREWGLTLDAAGYPSTSRLPASYAMPAAQSLAPAVPAAAAEPGREAVRRDTTVSVPVEPAASGPRIRF
ncbi:glutaredoxin [Sphaerotilus hippei]|uniref:Glutaredoxin n=1 Tax=Sphaerotilus hippei TaxID=744406 RepID=A0A318H0J2_9BURK|nr:glutaredoxin family protein [Sphaerotilus hippei]PXW96264.1 glutaredoxin [Sphaerotilus hippei]